ncbi:MAG: hypothetical protein H0W83_06410 [Planctomycetes bacterium]|nr:hypothetical protein [Planctomycetota bacterium]
MNDSSRPSVDVSDLDAHMRAGAVDAAGLRWHAPTGEPIAVRGLAWFAAERRYRRLPLAPRLAIRPAVDELANCTAGAQLHLITDSRRLSLRARLGSFGLMHHMAATGQSGFDCYVGAPGAEEYVSTTIWDQKLSAITCPLYDGTQRARRSVIINFPLYQGVLELAIGIDADAALAPPEPMRIARPIVWYGTSITQGGCASRPGMAHTNILARRLGAEILNLGFSGNGQGEPELAHLLSDIPDPACLVLDFDGNCYPDEKLSGNLPEFIRIYRAVHPQVPILVMTRPPYASERIHERERIAREARVGIQQRVVEILQAAGDRALTFCDVAAILPASYVDGTVDGGHPTDLGFQLLADALAAPLRGVLRGR